MSIFSDVLAKTGLPAEAYAPVETKLTEALNLITQNNKRVADVNASKTVDPSKPGYEDALDALWRAHVSDDPEIAKLEPEFQAAAEAYERLQKSLRELAKKHIKTPLSEDEAKATRKLVNDTKPTIEEAVKSAAAMTAIVDTMLGLKGEAIDGGIISMLPKIESLMNARGRKAGSTGVSYMTKAAEVFVDGKSTNRDGKGKFNYAADALSKLWDAERFGGNKVTPETLEEAYLNACGYADRAESKGDDESKLKDLEFEFTKEIEKQNPNDDSATRIPVTAKVKVVRRKAEAAKPEDKPETTKVETPEDKPENNNKPAAKPGTAKQVPQPKK